MVTLSENFAALADAHIDWSAGLGDLFLGCAVALVLTVVFLAGEADRNKVEP